MLRLCQGKVDEPWQDLLACHRLARLVGQGPNLVELLVAAAIDGMARGGDRALLEHAHLTAVQIAEMRADLDHLPPMSKMADKIDVAERCIYLDNVSRVAREGLSSIASFPTGSGNWEESGTLKSVIDSIGRMRIDWDVVCRMGNSWYDRVAEAYRKSDRADRRAALDVISRDLNELSRKSSRWQDLLPLLLLSGNRAGEHVGAPFVSLTFMAIWTVADFEDRWTMESELNKLAFALAAYRVDRGAYPAKLADLMPKYVKIVPKDIFNGAELHYRQEGGGYLLYSVGPNGKDDGGKTLEDRKANEDCDDLTVRISAKPH